MPTYQYRCSECGHQFDQFQKFSDDPLTECPVCAQSVRRVIQPVGVVFKGSGWYITDNRKSKAGDNQPAANGDSKSDAPVKDASVSKTESTSSGEAAVKPDASSDTKSDVKPATAGAKSPTPA